MLHLLLCIYRPLRSLFFGFDSSLSLLKQPSPLFGLHTLCMLSYSSSRLDLNAGAGDATVAVGGLAASWQGWLADRFFGGVVRNCTHRASSAYVCLASANGRMQHVWRVVQAEAPGQTGSEHIHLQ